MVSTGLRLLTSQPPAPLTASASPGACLPHYGAGARLHDVQLAAHVALPRQILAGPEPGQVAGHRCGGRAVGWVEAQGWC